MFLGRFLLLAGAASAFGPGHEDWIDELAYFQDSNNLEYVVEAVVYPEEPTMIYAACRGGGLTVVDATKPTELTIAHRWEHDQSVEGQDRIGDVLIVAEHGIAPSAEPTSPKLHVFDLSALETTGLMPSATIDLSAHVDAVLHAKLYVDEGGTMWAIVSPFAREKCRTTPTINSSTNCVSGAGWTRKDLHWRCGVFLVIRGRGREREQGLCFSKANTSC